MLLCALFQGSHIMSNSLPIYFDTNPLAVAAEFYGLDWDKDVLPATSGQHDIPYGNNKRWTISGVVISIYRMASGRYELTHYKS